MPTTRRAKRASPTTQLQISDLRFQIEILRWTIESHLWDLASPASFEFVQSANDGKAASGTVETVRKRGEEDSERSSADVSSPDLDDAAHLAGECAGATKSRTQSTC
jgi:hypothetical protein